MSRKEQILDWSRKYLFWVLCGVVAIFSLVSWYLGTNTLKTETKANLTKIESNFKKTIVDSNKVYSIHPNEAVNKELSTLSEKTENVVSETWKSLYEKQAKSIYLWPDQGNYALDKKFLDWLKLNPNWNVKLVPESEIQISFLGDYNSKILLQFEHLAKEIGQVYWPSELDPSAQLTPMPMTPAKGNPSDVNSTVNLLAPGVNDKLIWETADLQATYNRYRWPAQPDTLQVKLAQEDMWAYEQLLGIITRVNTKRNDTGELLKTPAGKPLLYAPHLRPIKVLERLAIEAFAVDANILGKDTNRIFRPATTTATPTPEASASSENPTPEGGDSTATAGPKISPPPERVGGSAGSSGSANPESREGGEAPAADAAVEAPQANTASKVPSHDLLNWRYVDSKHKPLSKAELESEEHKYDLYYQLPFLIRLHIVQSYIPRLLDELKNAPVPIEIRMYRENYSEMLSLHQSSSGSSSGSGLSGESGRNTGSIGSGGQGSGPTSPLLPDEVLVEISGVINFIRPVDPNLLKSVTGIGDAAATEPTAAAAPAGR